MWEWRIFYSEEDTPAWVSNITNLLFQIPMEERIDLYFNLNTNRYGLKVRAISEKAKLLELKVLNAIHVDFELWKKIVKHTIRINNYSTLIPDTISLLKNSGLYGEKTAPVVQILSEREIHLYELAKWRKKMTFKSISVEYVELMFRHQKLYGIELEASSANILRDFLEKKEIPYRKYINTSYPQLLLNLEKS